MVREYSDACGVAADLLAALEFSRGQDAGKHACEDGKGGWAADSKANYERLALVSVCHAFDAIEGSLLEHYGRRGARQR